MSVMNKFMNFIGLQEEEEVTMREQIVESSDEPETSVPESRKNKGNIVSIHSQKSTKVILCEPRSFEDSQDIADHLRSRRAVIVNLQRVKADMAQRIFDFLNGTVYALGGNVNRVGPSIFICTPDNVEIQGSISEILEQEAEYNKSR